MMDCDGGKVEEGQGTVEEQVGWGKVPRMRVCVLGGREGIKQLLPCLGALSPPPPLPQNNTPSQAKSASSLVPLP
jgi:hypothetical protein